MEKTLRDYQNTHNLYQGKLEITDKVLLSDPCYDLGTWCTAEAELPKGTYNCYSRQHEGRISSIFVLKEDFDNKGELYLVDLENPIENLGVDSGQLGIFNLDRFNKPVSKEVFEKSLGKEFPYEDWKRLWEDNMSDEDKFYKCCCNTTLNKDKCGVVEGVGFVSSSGWGDGTYVAFYLNDFKENRIGLQVIFIDEDEMLEN